MALRTLEELNRAFMAGSPAHEQTKFEPITPLVIEVALPGTMKPPGIDGRKPEDAGIYEKHPKQKRQKKKRGLFTAISDMLFSLAIIMILFVVLIPGSEGGTPKTILDYSYFTVLTPSMQDEIPQGSFILVKKADPAEFSISR